MYFKTLLSLSYERGQERSARIIIYTGERGGRDTSGSGERGESESFLLIKLPSYEIMGSWGGYSRTEPYPYLSLLYWGSMPYPEGWVRNPQQSSPFGLQLCCRAGSPRCWRLETHPAYFFKKKNMFSTYILIFINKYIIYMIEN